MIICACVHETVPEQPTNLQGEARSPNTIQLTWDAPELSSDELIDSYELYYNDSHFRQNVHVTIAPPRNTHLLTDLTPDTVYHIRVAAKSARGEGASTPTVQVRTVEYGTRTFTVVFITNVLYLLQSFGQNVGWRIARQPLVSILLSRSCLSRSVVLFATL